MIELKIPTAYANLSNTELQNLKLGEIARIRELYRNLDPVDGTERERGKARNAPRRTQVD